MARHSLEAQLMHEKRPTSRRHADCGVSLHEELLRQGRVGQAAVWGLNAERDFHWRDPQQRHARFDQRQSLASVPLPSMESNHE